MFRRILIANRGEVAARVQRTCTRLGIETVAVYSTADREASYLQEATLSVCIGPGRADASYLRGERILQVALQTGCEALHPGWGFLSEQAPFAAMCEQAGVRFIGPSAAVMRTMGEKAAARSAAQTVGLPLIPGSQLLSSAEHAEAEARRVGFPVLLKADAGGGGRGMRVARNLEELHAGYAAASAEARAAFGNPALYLERYIEGGRHIEFQVLADRWGNAVHLGERECSVQRRHQKLIEEAPSVAVSEALRSAMGEKVARAARELSYEGVGTVELLMDSSGDLYFIEMNTRLQVEHTITEELTGIDLVEAQLRVAAGERLWFAQEDLVLDGHAIECRINAEDPDADFRPVAGTVEVLAVGLEGDVPEGRVRFDTHVQDGYTVPPYYDSMLGKLIVHAPTRAKAIALMEQALSALQVEGVCTTRSVHQRVLGAEAFRAGSYDTKFLPALLGG